jgi:phospholipid/cholesterol/gamma-HCH transport system substrate-binding protein
VRRKIERVLDAQNAPPELLATDLCMPVPGSPC